MPGQRVPAAGTGQIGAGAVGAQMGSLRRGRPSFVGCSAVGPTGRSGRTATMGAGIAAWGTYLPYWRLQRSAIGAVLGSGGGQGTRAVASYDEDTTTLGVEAGRRALAVGPGAVAVQDLFLSTPDPGYLDKTSATTVHAALGLGRACGAYDFAGSSRSAVATLLQALVGATGRRVAPRWPWSRTCGRGSPARPRSETAATPPRPSSARRMGRWPSSSGAARRATSSSTAGGCRARPTPTCGRSASARRSTSRWPGRPSPPR